MSKSEQSSPSVGSVERFSATTEDAFLVNSFLVASENGLVLVDTQFLVSPARALRERVASSGRPLQAVVISHPHPDHFGGTGILLEGLAGVPVYATQATLDGIRASDGPKREFWKPIHKAEYPSSTIFPDRVVGSSETLDIDGLELIIDDVGAGESGNSSVIYLPQTRTLIASDLVYNKIHPWLAEGRSAAWLRQLLAVKERYPQAEKVYAGHGGEGSLALLDEQAQYIRSFRELVQRDLHTGQVSDPAKASIVEEMKRRYPGFAMTNLIAMGVDGVAGELSAE